MNLKSVLKKWMLKKAFSKGIIFNLFYYYRHGYFPQIKRPRTFNEKINHRKRYSKNLLFCSCSDKIEVKNYVSKIIDNKYIIPTISIHNEIHEKDIIEAFNKYGPIVVKTNHDSGGVFIINSLKDDLSHIIEEINTRLKFKHGAILNEQWYVDIRPMVLIEQKLLGDTSDYKFHMFKRKDNTFNIVLQIDIDRDGNHTRTLYDENFIWLPFSLEKPCIHNNFEKPKNFDLMINLAKKLAEPFNYVRVDLYNIDGKIYFGELTFSHGSGNEVFSTKGHDMWMGKLWELDPKN